MQLHYGPGYRLLSFLLGCFFKDPTFASESSLMFAVGLIPVKALEAAVVTIADARRTLRATEDAAFDI